MTRTKRLRCMASIVFTFALVAAFSIPRGAPAEERPGVEGPIGQPVAKEEKDGDADANAKNRKRIPEAKVRKQIKQLEDKDGKVRAAASDWLASGDADVIKILEEGIRPGAADLNFRIIKIVSRLRWAKDEETRQAAATLLEKLRESKDVAIAQQAHEARRRGIPPLSRLARPLAVGFTDTRGHFTDTRTGNVVELPVFLGGDGLSELNGTTGLHATTTSQIVISGARDKGRWVHAYQAIGRVIQMHLTENHIEIYVSEWSQDGGREQFSYHAEDVDELKMKQPMGYRYYRNFIGYKGAGITIEPVPED